MFLRAPCMSSPFHWGLCVWRPKTTPTAHQRKCAHTVHVRSTRRPRAHATSLLGNLEREHCKANSKTAPPEICGCHYYARSAFLLSTPTRMAMHSATENVCAKSLAGGGGAHKLNYAKSFRIIACVLWWWWCGKLGDSDDAIALSVPSSASSFVSFRRLETSTSKNCTYVSKANAIRITHERAHKFPACWHALCGKFTAHTHDSSSVGRPRNLSSQLFSTLLHLCSMFASRSPRTHARKFCKTDTCIILFIYENRLHRTLPGTVKTAATTAVADRWTKFPSTQRNV